MPPFENGEKTIVIRDRRKPNQYTTDNVIAREWLPILRVGDAFFFFSVYLSMANRKTESSWSSLRTLARYLQCGVDLVIRGNKLLEICELIYVETGNQRTSNEYYILDPPSLTPELKARIHQRLDDISAQETSKNWQSWIRQVRKALDRHQSLPSIWAERRAKRGGRPIKTVRPQEGVCEAQAEFSEQSTDLEKKPARDSQAGYVCATSTEHVRHKQGARETQTEQEQLTKRSEQSKSKETHLLLLVLSKCRQLGIAPSVVDVLIEKYSVHCLVQQLEWLPFRHARDPAAMLVSSVQGNWTQPEQYDPQRAQEIWRDWLGAETSSAVSPVAQLEGSDENAGSTLALHAEVLSPSHLPGDDGGGPSATKRSPVATKDRTGSHKHLTGGQARSHLRDAVGVWARALEELRMQMTRATFDTWLEGSLVTRADGDDMTVRVRDEYAVEWLRARWLVPIQRTLSGVVGRPVQIHFEV